MAKLNHTGNKSSGQRVTSRSVAAYASASRSARNSSRSGYAGESTTTKKKTKVTRAQRLMRLALLVFIVLVVVVSGIMLLTSDPKDDERPATIDELTKTRDTFAPGVSVCGVDIGGKTVAEAKPEVDAAVKKLMGEVSITISHDQESFTFTAADMQLQSNVPEALVEAMAYGDKEGGAPKQFDVTLTPSVDAIMSRLNALASSINSPAVEPHVVPELKLDPIEAVFTPVEGRNGLMLNSEKTAQLIEETVLRGAYQERLSPVFDELPPTVDINELMANTKKIASFSTDYSYRKSDETISNRCFNIEKAAGILNNTVWQAGETFSFNDLEGPRTAETGWKQANGIRGGKEFTLQYGGGICQVSTTLYGAVLRANLKIPEGGRRKHSIPSTYVDKGLDATVDTSGIDFKFENDTGYPIYIFAYPVAKSSSRYELVVSIYGKPLPDGVEYKPVSEVSEPIPAKEPKLTNDPTIPLGYQVQDIEARDGYSATVYMEKYENGELVSREKLYSDNYGGNVAEIRIGTGDPLTTPIPENATAIAGQPAQPQPHEETNDQIIAAGV